MRWLATIVVFLLVAPGMSLLAGIAGADDAVPQAGMTPTVAILVLSNHTSDPEAALVFEPLIREQLSTLGLSVVGATDLREVLRRHRIRAVGEIGAAGADALRADLGVDLVLTGSLDVFVPDDQIPEAGLSLRLTDLATRRVVWAHSEGATGRDFESVFGLGRAVTMDDLASRIVAIAMESIPKSLRADRSSTPPRVETVAVVPFDDIVLESPGSGIVTAQTLTHLVRRGYDVLEPGVVRELFLRFQRFPRGGIDLELLRALHDSLGVAMVVTGTVDQLRTAVPGAEQSYPAVSLSGRVIDTQSGRIIRVADISADGDREVALGMGNTFAASGVAQSSTSRMLNRLDLKEGGRDRTN